jgi:hypothetical protein
MVAIGGWDLRTSKRVAPTNGRSAEAGADYSPRIRPVQDCVLRRACALFGVSPTRNGRRAMKAALGPGSAACSRRRS